MGILTTRVVSPAPRSEWLRLRDLDATATLSQDPEWTDVLCRRTRWRDASRYYETSDGRSFVLPLVTRGLNGTAGVFASMPAGWGMGGFVAEEPITASDVDMVAEDLQGRRGMGYRILPNPLRNDSWGAARLGGATAIPRFSHVLDLQGGFQEVWQHRFRQTARRNVRKALRSDLEIERDSTGRLIPVYRDLLRRSVTRWAATTNEPHWLAKIRANRDDPPGKLEYLGQNLGERMVTMVAWYRGEAAAAIIILTGNSHFYWRGAMHEGLGPRTHAAYALQSAAIEEACDAGAAWYYFGESGQSSGLAHFKERFGAVGHQYREVRFERLPITRATTTARSAVKRLVGYNAR